MNSDRCGIPLLAMLHITSDEPETIARIACVATDVSRKWVREWAQWYMRVPEETRDRIHALLVKAAWKGCE